jgi:hypothetical protein
MREEQAGVRVSVTHLAEEEGKRGVHECGDEKTCQWKQPERRKASELLERLDDLAA